MRRSLSAYQPKLNAMEERNDYYEGTPECKTPSGATASKKASNVRNIVYELLESEVDSTIPMPRVEPIHEEDKELARGIEAMLRHKIIQMRLTDMNDIQERTTVIQGGAFWHVEWDSSAGFHCTLGDVAISDRHPKQIIPQDGVYEIEDMDYFFVRIVQTKEYIKRVYGKDVSYEGVDDDSNTFDDVQNDDLVTQNIAYYRNENGIGMFSWCGNVVLADIDDYQARHSKRCRECGAIVYGDRCECGSKKLQDEVDEFEELTKDITLYDGTVIPQFSDFVQQPILDANGLPVLDELGNEMTQEVAQATKIPHYKPDKYPIVLRRNISKFGSFLGGSDVDVIEDQQEAIKKLGTKIDEKVLKGGSFVTLPEGVKIETTDRELKILRVRNPADKALIDVLNVQPDITKDRVALDDNYQWARSTLGITDAFQGKYDSSATSGTAKQFSANQAAGRMQSKREQKNSAYAKLYELMFKFYLAYADEPIPYSQERAGVREFAHFNRWDFLRMDAAGEFYWDDEFIFTVDPSATLSSNRSELWNQMDLKLQSGAFGLAANLSTQKLYWTLMHNLDFPYAGDIKAAIEAEEQKQMEAVQQQEAMQSALSQMQNGNAGASVLPGNG